MLSKKVTARQELILFALNKGPLYGAQIKGAIEAASGGTRRMLDGSLIPALTELELSGLVSSSGVKGEQKRRYSLTEGGRKALEEVQQFRAALLGGVTQ